MRGERILRRTVDSHVGPLALASDGAALVGLDWGRALSEDADGVLDAAAARLEEYFAGTCGVFDLPLRPVGTPFQGRVWQALLAIPRGRVETYGSLARVLGSSPRAVRQACGRNPIAVIIQRHRVVAATGLGGFSRAARRLDIKSRLLELERSEGDVSRETPLPGILAPA